MTPFRSFGRIYEFVKSDGQRPADSIRFNFETEAVGMVRPLLHDPHFRGELLRMVLLEDSFAPVTRYSDEALAAAVAGLLTRNRYWVVERKDLASSAPASGAAAVADAPPPPPKPTPKSPAKGAAPASAPPPGKVRVKATVAPAKVKRGEQVTISATVIEGEATEFEWEIARDHVKGVPDTAPVVVKQKEFKFHVLGPVSATLRVNGAKVEPAKVSVEVVARAPFKLEYTPAKDTGDRTYPFQYKPDPPAKEGEKQKRHFQGIANRFMAGVVMEVFKGDPPSLMAGRCGCDVGGQDCWFEDHFIHRAPGSTSWRGSAYEIRKIEDGGPFDGFFFVSECTLKVKRIILLNLELFEGGGVYNENKKQEPLLKTLKKLWRSTEDHERAHEHAMGLALTPGKESELKASFPDVFTADGVAGAPAKIGADLEAMIAAGEDDLVQNVDDRIKLLERTIKTVGVDHDFTKKRLEKPDRGYGDKAVVYIAPGKPPVRGTYSTFGVD